MREFFCLFLEERGEREREQGGVGSGRVSKSEERRRPAESMRFAFASARLAHDKLASIYLFSRRHGCQSMLGRKDAA